MRGTLIDDRYAILETLGGGGMAEVFRARDEVLGREVALKILRGQYAGDEEFVERFRREAKSAAALNHPNIVQVYDQGRANDGTYYMAMEYVPGGTLKERIVREGRLNPREAARIASRVAEALDVAHYRGIVHRDIKPQNILIGDSGEAKVADFGIARAATAKTVTETSLILGTAAYMSPEQVRGERVGPASDLYSLGVVLYEMLTGELPYTGEHPLATAMKHLDEPPRHPKEANPAVPEELDALTTKLLAKDPEKRYASAAELAEDLGRVRDGLPPLAAGTEEDTTPRMAPGTGKTLTAPVAAPARGRVPASRSRRRWALLLAALLLGAALLGGLAWALSGGLTDQGSPASARVEVPDVVGLGQNEAQRRLEDAGLKLGAQDEASSEQVAVGAVIEQNPAAGTKAERGTAVDLIVSAGPPQELTTASPTATPTATQTATPTASSTASSTASQSAAPEANRGAQGDRQGAAVKEMQREIKKELGSGGEGKAKKGGKNKKGRNKGRK
jgi:hypothetical protein